MEPLTPIKDPTVVNNGLSSMNPANRTPSDEHNVRDIQDKPSATRANPEYAFRTVMITARHRHDFKARSTEQHPERTYACPLLQQPQ